MGLGGSRDPALLNPGLSAPVRAVAPPGRVTDPGPGTADSLKHCPPPSRVTDPCLGPMDRLKHCPPPGRVTDPGPKIADSLKRCPLASQDMDPGPRPLTASSTAPHLPGHGSGSDLRQSQALPLAQHRHRSEFGTTDSLPQRPPPTRSRIWVRTADSLKHCPLPTRSRIRVPDRRQPQALPPTQQGHRSSPKLWTALPTASRLQYAN
ncbi:hypothetical protein MDA_GLEAN10009847 [Myotis davidii]|uniref:Uncharacterized protein n=1 Tax=Myotis davidii TaxID=225400 RepID=L5M1A5_MYODS|nr:hypothetical protein MDA_GLEAN10009847 [Myotis davidii]